MEGGSAALPDVPRQIVLHWSETPSSRIHLIASQESQPQCARSQISLQMQVQTLSACLQPCTLGEETLPSGTSWRAGQLQPLTGFPSEPYQDKSQGRRRQSRR